MSHASASGMRAVMWPGRILYHVPSGAPTSGAGPFLFCIIVLDVTGSGTSGGTLSHGSVRCLLGLSYGGAICTSWRGLCPDIRSLARLLSVGMPWPSTGGPHPSALVAQAGHTLSYTPSVLPRWAWSLVDPVLGSVGMFRGPVVCICYCRLVALCCPTPCWIRARCLLFSFVLRLVSCCEKAQSHTEYAMYS